MDRHFCSVKRGSTEFCVICGIGYFRLEGSYEDGYHMHTVVKWLFSHVLISKICLWLLNLTICVFPLGMWRAWDIKLREKKIFSILKSTQFDVVFLQETHLYAEESEKLCWEWVSHVYYSVGSSQSCGVLTLINKKLQFKCIRQSKDTMGRILIVVAETRSHDYFDKYLIL